MLPNTVVIFGSDASLLPDVRQWAFVPELARSGPLIEETYSLLTVHVYSGCQT